MSEASLHEWQIIDVREEQEDISGLQVRHLTQKRKYKINSLHEFGYIQGIYNAI